MTIEELKKAYKNGEAIQFKLDGKGWTDWENPKFDCLPCDYRIKPKCRPFKDCDELIATWQKMMGYSAKANTMPLIWVKCKSDTNKNGYWDSIGEICCITGFGRDFVHCEVGNPTMEVLFDDFEFLDGSPLGIEE